MRIYCFCPIGLQPVLKLSAAIVFYVSLPVMPVIVTCRNRKKHPVQAKILYWG